METEKGHHRIIIIIIETELERNADIIETGYEQNKDSVETRQRHHKHRIEAAFIQ